METTMTWTTKTCRHEYYVYHLKSHASYGFYTGETAAGGKVILGTMIRNILLIVFGSDGRYNKTVTIKLPSRIDPDLRLRYPDYEDPELAKLMEDEQIAERAIGVRRFFDYDNHVGIRDLPESFVDYLENEDSFLAGESEEIRKEEIDWIESAIERWKNTGDYVFWWDKDYYVNILGEVVSS